MKRGMVVVAVVAFVAASLVFALPARASFHLIRITEIFPGTSSVPEAQYVELQMYSPNQTQTDGQQLIVYDGTGLELASFTFHRNLPNGANQAHILVATPDAEDMFGVQSDLVMSDELIVEGGKVCWGTPDFLIDCASWGKYGGGDEPGGGQTGTPFNQGTALVFGQSMTRKTSGGSDPSKLDEGDDTNDSAADFQAASPTPEGNSIGEPSPSPSPSTEPGLTEHARTITLSLAGTLTASGRVTATDGFAQCAASVPVIVQRKKGRAFKTVAKTHADAEGAYRVHAANKPGTYRAKAKLFSPSATDRCLGATSKTAHH